LIKRATTAYDSPRDGPWGVSVVVEKMGEGQRLREAGEIGGDVKVIYKPHIYIYTHTHICMYVCIRYFQIKNYKYFE